MSLYVFNETNSGMRTKYLRLLIALIIGLCIASSWLVFPYFVQGKKLLTDVGDTSRVIKGGSVSRYYTRQLIFHPKLELSATFATSEFFQYVDNANVIGSLRPDKYFIFFVSENIHSGNLGAEPPDVVLEVDGVAYDPVLVDGPAAAEHHRVTIYSFSKRDVGGDEIRLNDVSELALFVSDDWETPNQILTFSSQWAAPFDLPEELSSGSGLTLIAALALGAGLLSSVLTPCLLQLVVVFGSILAGFGSVPAADSTAAHEFTPVVRKKIMQVALAFVAGFVLLYMAAGALIGAAGHQAQLIFAEYSRVVAIVSGCLVIALGLWVGYRGSSSLYCSLPNQYTLDSMSFKDSIGAILLSIGYALGCTACFGGAIVATLIVYVGAIGSASIGAGVMLVFSIGVAIPFLLSAYYLSRMDSILRFMVEKSDVLSKASMLLIIAFGLILITDNFHTVSDFIYPYLGLN